MPRGRHRHSAPLHRLLPPLTVAATSVVCAAGALAVSETAVIRGLAAAAAAATVVGSVMMRRWDRAAGKRVAQLTTARTREEWKTEERIAELETDLEETRLTRTRLEAKLRGKRAELARLRTEHADLLRRYAAAETGRASALEGRRLLAKGSGTTKALPAAGTPSGTGLDPAAFRKAADALHALERRAAAVEVKVEVKAEVEKDAAEKTASVEKPVEKPVAEKAVAEKAAVVPAVRRKASRAQGGFDFFGNKKKSSPAAAKPVEEQDLADVVGEEALAEAEEAVIDLTAHDETEQIDVAELRTAIS